MPWASVRENVRLPLKLSHAPAADADSRIEDALAQVGLSEFADAYPRELSGGMKMRVSLARALVAWSPALVWLIVTVHRYKVIGIASNAC